MFVADGKGGNDTPVHVDERGEHNHFPAWSVDDKLIYYTHGIQGPTLTSGASVPTAGNENG